MQCKKIAVLFVFSSMLSVETFSQLRLPSLDISVKTGYMFMPDEYSIPTSTGQQSVSFQYESLWTQGEVNFHFGQHIAFGLHYNRSAKGGYVNHDGDQPAEDAEHLMYGAQVRLSTGRSAKIRPYGQLKYFRSELVVHNSGYDVASQASGAIIAVGLMIRLNNKIYLNLPEFQYGALIDTGELLFREKNSIYKAGIGLTYNFSRRK